MRRFRRRGNRISGQRADRDGDPIGAVDRFHLLRARQRHRNWVGAWDGRGIHSDLPACVDRGSRSGTRSGRQRGFRWLRRPRKFDRFRRIRHRFRDRVRGFIRCLHGLAAALGAIRSRQRERRDSRQPDRSVSDPAGRIWRRGKQALQPAPLRKGRFRWYQQCQNDKKSEHRGSPPTELRYYESLAGIMAPRVIRICPADERRRNAGLG